MPAKPQADTPGSNGAVKDAFRGMMVESLKDMPPVTNPVQEALDEHFGADSLDLPTAAIRFSYYLQINYQYGLEDFLANGTKEQRLVGLRCPSVPSYYMGQISFARLLSKPTFAFVPPVFGPLDYLTVTSGSETKHPCLCQGLILFRDEQGPGAIWIRNDLYESEIVYEVMASTLERAEAVIADIKDRARRLSPYHGQVLELSADANNTPIVKFVERPKRTEADDVILPPGLLDQIELHSMGVIMAREALEASGRHKKRGLLLHGRPGTGKTHTIKYLISQMPNATVAVMSGAHLFRVDVLRQLVDLVVPGVIVLDDVDLIAEDRAMPGMSPRRYLFELLDVLDGISEDADLLFVMTTNRPNEIEPAIAARPGRVDQAIEVPLPDADCRRRLFDLYTKGLALTVSDDERQAFLDRTDGSTASFIREVLRRAAVASLRDGTAGSDESTISVTGAQVLAALDQLLSPDNPLTPLLLGAEPKHAVATVAAASIAPSPA